MFTSAKWHIVAFLRTECYIYNFCKLQRASSSVIHSIQLRLATWETGEAIFFFVFDFERTFLYAHKAYLFFQHLNVLYRVRYLTIGVFMLRRESLKRNLSTHFYFYIPKALTSIFTHINAKRASESEGRLIKVRIIFFVIIIIIEVTPGCEDSYWKLKLPMFRRLCLLNLFFQFLIPRNQFRWNF